MKLSKYLKTVTLNILELPLTKLHCVFFYQGLLSLTLCVCLFGMIIML